MTITIIGGWGTKHRDNKRWDLISDSKSDIPRACRAIGRRLALGKHTVILGSDKENSADYHVLQGMVDIFKSVKQIRCTVKLIEGIESSEMLYPDVRAHWPKYFLSADDVSVGLNASPRAAAKILSVEKADVVLTIGGLDDTYIAGVAAIVARKVVVPIATFGGASQQLLLALKGFDDIPQRDEHKLLANRMWNDGVLEAAFGLGGIDQPAIFFGYSGKSSKSAAGISQFVKDLGFEVIDWPFDFRQGEIILHEITYAAYRARYGMFLFSPDEGIGQNSSMGIPRSNVVFEAGYFIRRLGPRRTLIIVQRGTAVPSDLDGYIHEVLDDPSDLAPLKDRLQHFFQ